MYSLLFVLTIGISSSLQSISAKDEVKVTVIYKPPNCSKKSKNGDILTTEYVGYFLDGRKFDATYDRHEPMKYTMGAEEVVKGAEMADLGMCVGEKRNTVIPASLAYGDKDYAQIPGGSTLVFDSTLIKLEEGESEDQNLAAMGMTKNADGSFPLFK